MRILSSIALAIILLVLPPVAQELPKGVTRPIFRHPASQPDDDADRRAGRRPHEP